MIADRPYMRRSYSRFNWSVTGVLIAVNVAVFVLQIASSPTLYFKLVEFGALSLKGVQDHYYWQFLTFQFLHGGIWHLVVNLFMLYMFGRPLEDALGKGAFLMMYLASGVAGGLLQILLALVWPVLGGPMVGASAGISGVVGAFALLRPDLTFLFMFIIPLRAKHFLWLLIGISALCLVFNWSPGVAHAAHLGGILFGVAYLRWMRDSDLVAFWHRWKPRRRSRPIVKVRFPKASSSWEPGPAPARRTEEGDFISKEVDPILDKVNAHGIQSLTQLERDILDKAREKLRSGSL
jgi:membrane associated rhomboid family serine protease